MNAFQDGTGATSSMRVVMLLWSFMLIGCSLYLVIVNGKFPDIPPSFVEISLFVLAGKVGQSFAENKAPQQPPTP